MSLIPVTEFVFVAALLCFWVSSLRPDDLGPKELPVLNEEEDEDEEEMETVVCEAPQEKWDCETIISKSLFTVATRRGT